MVTIMLGVEQDTLAIPLHLEQNIPQHTVQLGPLDQTEVLCDLQSVTQMQPQEPPSEESFSCEYCDSKFMTEINLSTHVTDYHLEIKCKECSEAG